MEDKDKKEVIPLLPSFSEKVHVDKPVFSRAVRYGQFVFLSGEVGFDPEVGKIVDGGIRPQTQTAFKNIIRTLKDAGTSFDNVIKMTVFLVNPEDFEGYAEVRSKFVPKDPPADTLIYIKRLFFEEALVEIDITATMP